jgi:hypothetical protein
VDQELMALLIEVTSITATEKTRLQKPIKIPRPSSNKTSGSKAAAAGVKNIPDDRYKQGVAVLAATTKRRAVTAG